MKNKYFDSVLPAIMLVFALLLAGCDNPVEPTSQPDGATSQPDEITTAAPGPQTPTITVQPQGAGYHPSALPKPLTVEANVTDGGTLWYDWYKNTENSTVGGTYIDGAYNKSYTPEILSKVTDDVVTYYYVVVTNYDDYSHRLSTRITSDVVAITVTNSIIVDAKEPIITAQPVGKSYMNTDTARAALTVTAKSPDGGTLSYQWFRNTINSATEGTPTAVGSNSSYVTPAANLLGTFYYYVVVTSTNSKVNGTRTATATSNTAEVTVTPGPLTGTVSISGDAVVGQTLRAVITALGGSGTISYEWTYGDSEDVKGTSSYYYLTDADVGKTIKVTVTRSLCTGEKSAQTLAAVVVPVTLNGNIITAHSSATAEEVGAVLSAYLASASGGSSAANHVVVKIEVANENQLGYAYGLIEMLFDANTAGKYVSYDLSASTLTTMRGAYSSRNNADKLVSVTLPNTLKSIGSGAFSDCSGLTSIIIPNSVTSIGDRAFSGCSNLTSVTIPDSVTSIGDRAFSGCSSLTAITVGSGNTSYKSIEGVLFNNAETELLQYPSDKTGTAYTIPNSVTSISDYAFYGCGGLSEVTIPNSVTSIGYEAFYGCSSLTSVTIGSGVTSLGYGPFYDCSSLTSIRVDSGNTSYKSSADGVLFNQTGTELLLYPQGKTDTSYTIPYGVKSIGDRAFFGCSSLTSVTIPDSVESIGRSAFSGCSGLSEVTIPSSVTSIGQWAFNYCSNLTSVTMRPSTPPTLGLRVFYGTPANFKIKVASDLYATYKNTTVSGWTAEYKAMVVEE